jgi:hypothetical protein
MGYTHYFSFARKRPPASASWAAFTREVRAILAHPMVASRLCYEFDEPDRSPQVDDDAVRFNGKGDDGHETFALYRAELSRFSGFCKTGGLDQADLVDQWGKPYDPAVCAVLISAARHLGLQVSSDGDWSDPGWQAGRALYARTTSHIATCPWSERQCGQCSRRFSVDGHAWGDRKRTCVRCGCQSYSGSYVYGVGGRKRATYTCARCGGHRMALRGSPESWCWYCSNGYANKDDAAKDVGARLEATLAALEKCAPKSRREEV